VRFGSWALRIGFVALLVALWQWQAVRSGSPFFPPPTEIFDVMRHEWFSGPGSRLFLADSFFEQVIPSVRRVLVGWSLAAVLGVSAGLLIGRSARLRPYVEPIINFLRALPAPTLIPVFLILFGIGPTMRIAVIVFGVIWPVLLNTIQGAKSVPASYLDVADAYKIGRTRRFFHIVMASASPKVFAGLRVSLSLSVILMVISEMVAGTEGIGFTLIQAQRSFAFPKMWAMLVVLGALGYLLNSLLLISERRVLAWHYGQKEHR
jgi:ABC-type nitrate/sulfonate/bicarbonate transport system permease component